MFYLCFKIKDITDEQNIVMDLNGNSHVCSTFTSAMYFSFKILRNLFS